MCHNWLHTPDYKELNEIENQTNCGPQFPGLQKAPEVKVLSATAL